MSDLEVEREVMREYDSMEEFERDFGYTLESQYKDLDLTE